MNSSFEQISILQYRLKAAYEKIKAYESGEMYTKLKEEHKKEVRVLQRQNKQIKNELCQTRKAFITMRNEWFTIFDEYEKEKEKEIAKANEKAIFEKNYRYRVEKERDELIEEKANMRKEIYQLKIELTDEKDKRQKLIAQVNRNHENSSLPSSKVLRRKKISNSREKTDKKPGGQLGHKGHKRKKQVPTKEPILLSPPIEVIEDKDFRKTKETIKKQRIGLRVIVDVTEYHADVYRHKKTGEKVHATFPKGVVNEVNYDGSIKAFLFLLNNDCCISIDKSRKFLAEITEGKLELSKGMINNLSKEFAKKSEQERKKVLSDMLLSPVMHTDCTNAKVNGKNSYVYICATPEGEALYYAREKKGHKRVEGTATEEYQGILVHDHEKTFYRYGSLHQECLAHVLRYLKDSMENEKERTWHKQMHTLLKEMIHERKTLLAEENMAHHKVVAYEERYKKILEKAKKEYEDIPPSKYYRDGYNLYHRMDEYMKHHLLFLHNYKVPTTNNEAERLLRQYKRKQQQAVTFRSNESLEYLCKCMSMLVMMRRKEMDVFHEVSKIFEQ